METSEETAILRKARDFFPSARIFLTQGLNYRINGRSASAIYQNIEDFISISPEDWERIKDYASRSDNNESYDPKSFVRACV